ncbi:hypothetical protein QQS21_012557 [Conoideocrella luteorostrata]|uniref:Uncharacterized protein n=1 Tax=Conoideocrella luteorostrata TaxID=1105319 RepID=A0AAJ0FMJ9_9HYPO|nr:hypothetical protein QQS21_012557 [Conoideocrella luteorostrata]
MSIASFSHSTGSSSAHLQVPGAMASGPVRPKFNSHVTSDRLREGAGLYLPPLFQTPSSSIRKGRVSVFKEMGLDDLAVSQTPIDEKFLGSSNTAVYSARTISHR